MPSVLVCGESPTVRMVMRRTLATIPSITKVGVVSSGEELISRWSQLKVDVVLLGTGLSGIGPKRTIELLLAMDPSVTVLAIAHQDLPEELRQSIAAGAHGYVSSDASRQELAGALAHGAAMAEIHSRGITESGVPLSETDLPKADDMIALSPRELQVLTGMGQGDSNKEIGADLDLAADTVKTHGGRILRKLGARDRAHAVAVAYRRGIIR